jgi:hypothetical protein
MRKARIAKAILSRIAVYGGLLFVAWWWMLWTPGPETVPALRPLNPSQLELEQQLRQDVAFLAGAIGERNIPGRP